MDRTGPPPPEGPPPDAEASGCTAVLELRGTQVARGRAQLLHAGERRWLHFETLWMTLPPTQFRQVLRAVIPGRVSLDEYVAYPLGYREALPELGGLHVSGLLLALEEQRGAGPPHPEPLHEPSAAVRAGYSALLARLPPELGGRLRAPAAQQNSSQQAASQQADAQAAPDPAQRPAGAAGREPAGWPGPRWRRAHQELPELLRPVLLWTGARLCCAERRPGAPPWSVTLYPADEAQNGRWHWQLDRAPDSSEGDPGAALPESRWAWTELPLPPEDN